MNPSELQQTPGVQLLDVRLADDFEAAHLEGAVNNCVFEVAFRDRLSATAPNREAPTVVYGANGSSGEAAAAADKLRRAGYLDIHLLEGGLVGAKAAGLPLLSGDPLPEPPRIANGSHPIDFEESRVEWTGRNLINKHWGTVPIRAGELHFQEGKLTGGTITLDLLGLTCTDLAGNELHDVLIAHLHNEDFFDVEHHPEATLQIRQATPIEGSSPGAPNLRIHADLTLRGQTQAIEFTAATGVTPEGKAAAQASFSIDRTRWGVLYGSGKFFHRLAGHLVNDHVDFQIRLLTQ